MNENANNGAVVVSPAAETPRQVGRPRNPNCMRTIYLNADNTPRAKGAPKVGSQVKCVDVQRSIKNSEFNYLTTPFTNERTITVGPRKNSKPVVVVEQTMPVQSVESPVVPVVETPVVAPVAA